MPAKPVVLTLILERFSLKIEMGGKPFLLSRLDRLLAKTDGTVNSGAFM